MVNTHSMPVPIPAQDPISRDFTQISTHGEDVRRLIVSYGARSVREPDGRSTPAPFLRLQGAWLSRAGFAVGVPVTVRVSRGRLVIEVVAPERSGRR